MMRTEVDLALHVIATDGAICGTVGGADHSDFAFSGWLELTAVLAQLLAAAGEASQPQKKTRQEG